jgi:hypothetical protein
VETVFSGKIMLQLTKTGAQPIQLETVAQEEEKAAPRRAT